MKLIWLLIGYIFWLLGWPLVLIRAFCNAWIDWIDEWLDYCEDKINDDSE